MAHPMGAGDAVIVKDGVGKVEVTVERQVSPEYDGVDHWTLTGGDLVLVIQADLITEEVRTRWPR